MDRGEAALSFVMVPDGSLESESALENAEELLALAFALRLRNDKVLTGGVDASMEPGK